MRLVHCSSTPWTPTNETHASSRSEKTKMLAPVEQTGREQMPAGPPFGSIPVDSLPGYRHTPPLPRGQRPEHYTTRRWVAPRAATRIHTYVPTPTRIRISPSHLLPLEAEHRPALAAAHHLRSFSPPPLLHPTPRRAPPPESRANPFHPRSRAERCLFPAQPGDYLQHFPPDSSGVVAPR